MVTIKKVKLPAVKVIVVFVLLWMGLLGSANAQDGVINDLNGVPLREKKYNIVEGSRYLSDAWVTGYVKFKRGKEAKNIQLKFDQLSGVLIFKNMNNQEFTFVSDVLEFGLPYTVENAAYSGVFRSGFSPIKDGNEHTFLEVLYDGKTKLLKQTVKAILETKAFYSATTESTIVQNFKCYVFMDGKLLPVKKEAADIMNVLSNREQVQAYIKDKKPKLKDDGELIELFKYYDSL